MRTRSLLTKKIYGSYSNPRAADVRLQSLSPQAGSRRRVLWWWWWLGEGWCVQKGGRRNINPSPSQHACRRKLQTYYSPLISLNEGGLSRRASLRDGDEVRRVIEACTGWEGKGEGGGGARYLPVVCRQTGYIYISTHPATRCENADRPHSRPTLTRRQVV